MGGNVQVVDISNTQLRITNSVAYSCYSPLGEVTSTKNSSIELGATSYMYSDDNVFTVIGCDDFGNVLNNDYSSLPKGCSTTCENIDEVREDGPCSGSGCCQVNINLLKKFKIVLKSFNNHKSVSLFSDCGYAFLGEKNFKFKGKSDLNDSGFWNRTMETVPIVLDWVIGNRNCTEAAQYKNSSVCYQNSKCVDGFGTRYRGYRGYRCNCNKGYQGNPYLSPGCQDRRVVREGTLDQLHNAAQLVKRCLNLNGEERPTMKEVTMEIENLRKLSKHPWTQGNEDTEVLIGQTDFQHSDLYEIQPSSYHNVVNDSDQYSSSTISLLHPPTSPR
uniref:Wall-associated receptor kinase domain-containing protein n=1 Tax=Daucus carota subsp. sativus TaxID=79200 RepID=A0A165ABH0_DAUCS